MDSTIIGALGGVFALLLTAFGFLLKGAAADRAELKEERKERRVLEKEVDAEQALRRAAEARGAKLEREVDRLTGILESFAKTKELPE